jgi:outer membrane protein assembly factor BamD (BamD/ComL family)
MRKQTLWASVILVSFGISAAPAQEAQQEQERRIQVGAARRDYELAIQIGTKEAMEAFLKVYPDAGLYTVLAKEQLAKLPAPPVEDLSPGQRPRDEEIAWERVRSADDSAVLRAFIERYPNSRFTELAKYRLQLLDRAANERR